MEVGAITEVKIVGLDHQGRGIGRIDGKTIFIPDALVDEVVKVRITVCKKKYLEGKVEEMITESSRRITPVCPYAAKCGGCDLLHMSYEDQVIYKENKVKDIMERFAGLDKELVKPIIKCDNPFYYRNKTTFQVADKIGFYHKKSNDIIEVDACMISDKKINKVLEKIEMVINPSCVNQVIVRASHGKKDCMVIIDYISSVKKKSVIAALKDIATSIVLKKNGIYETIYGADTITETLNGQTFIISPDSFFQIHTKQAEKMYNQVLEYCKLTGSESVLDLYCGTGTIGIYLSKYAAQVVGIEKNKDAILDAEENQIRNNVRNIEFLCGDVETEIMNVDAPDVIVVDPPRNGLESKTIDVMKKLSPARIVYVSCDPITLARDLKLLMDTYEVKEMTPVDMFSNTAHCEVIVLLELK